MGNTRKKAAIFGRRGSEIVYNKERLKKVLIISPYFPPVNTADMQRVRMSLPYFKENGWEPTVVAVKPQFVEAPIEENLLLTVPGDIEVFRVSAFSTSFTRRFGLGNLGFRSMLQILYKCITLFNKNKFDVVYFSTTAFPVIVIGRILKSIYNVPYVVDMQDPWRPDHYLGKPKHEQPPKFKFAYAINSFLEKLAIPKTDGIIAVSTGYIETLQDRYPSTRSAVTDTITFGASDLDFQILDKAEQFKNRFFQREKNIINILYVGRGGFDLHYSLNILFNAIKKGLEEDYDLFSRVRLYFIGTSYAKNGTGQKTIEPLAEEYNLGCYVKEVPDRVPYFEALNLLKDADLLFIPGSTEANYTASKLYPYILAQKNILAIFHEQSSVVEILEKTNAGHAVTFNTVQDDMKHLVKQTYCYLNNFIQNVDQKPQVDWNAFSFYSAKYMTFSQTEMFNRVLLNNKTIA